MTSEELFAKTPPTRLFFKAAIPGAIGMLAAAFYQTFDGIFVGQYLGTTAFVAVNLAMPFVVINFAVSDLIGVGSSVVISLLLVVLQPLGLTGIWLNFPGTAVLCALLSAGTLKAASAETHRPDVAREGTRQAK